MDSAIKKIVLDLGKKEITLTLEQAKKLKSALDEMFGKEVVKEIHHHDYWQWYPNWWPIYPNYQSPTGTGGKIWDYQTSSGCSANYSNNTMTLRVA